MKIRMKHFIVAMLTFVMLLCNSVTVAHAKTTDWVLDENNILSEETTSYISNLNENVYPNYSNKPQYGVVVIDKLPSGYTMDEYKLEMFNEYGVGTKKENCGVLFVIAISDREYGLEIGEGFERGSLLRQDLETDFVNSELKSLLREEKYDQVIFEITKKVESILADQENGVYATRQAEYDKNSEAAAKVASYLIIGLVGGGIIIFALHWLIKLVIMLIRRKKLVEAVDTYSHLVKYTGCSEEYVKSGIKHYWTDDISFGSIENFVLHRLYDSFISELSDKIKHSELSWSTERYLNRAEDVNSVEKFRRGEIVDVDEIIYMTNQEEQKRHDIREENRRNISEYVEKNADKIDASLEVSTEYVANKIFEKIVSDFRTVTKEQIASAFADVIRGLEFDREYEEFLKLSKDKIESRYFDKNDFKREILRSNEYRDNYHGGRILNHIWMMTLLQKHMRDNERAYKRRHSSSHRSSYSSSSSFGRSFGGGFSRGGGFSGGW